MLYKRATAHLNSLKKSFDFRRFKSNMASLHPPKSVREMTVLDRRRFTKILDVPTLRVPQTKLKETMLCLKKYLLKLDNFKPVQAQSEESDIKNVYLNPGKIAQWDHFDIADLNVLDNAGINKESFTHSNVEVGYDNWKCDEILKAVLPVDGETLSSYSIIGHIVHVNLRDHHLLYKSLIGQVLLDKIKGCKTVVNKTSAIDNTYRNFSMELLCGEDDFVTRVKENNCTFEFDFSKVYWNPRLCTEHERILKLLKDGDVLVDVFAGVGPFAIPALRKKCTVHANDLNPDSYKWLNHNADINKINQSLFKSYNMDGADFITKIFKDILLERYKDRKNERIQITMNLPAIAVTFLKYFVGILDEDVPVHEFPITIHVYCFVPGENPKEAAKELVVDNLGFDIEHDLVEIINVRNVSPNKEMMRVSFNVPHKLFKRNCTPEKRKIETSLEIEPNEKIVKHI